MARELIDPLNEDTYDDRVIMHGPIKSMPPNDAYRRGWDKIWSWKLNVKIERRKLCLIRN